MPQLDKAWLERLSDEDKQLIRQSAYKKIVSNGGLYPHQLPEERRLTPEEEYVWSWWRPREQRDAGRS